jgi:ribosomal protein S12 methylthiotransferase
MALQAGIAQEQAEAMLGREIDVLVEGVSDETDLLLKGRHSGQAPEIDGVTYINDGMANVGDVVRVRVEDAGVHDLVGGVVDTVYQA